MSGFAGILNLDGAPADPEILRSLTGSLAFRGPDGQETWCRGPIGMGHAMLRTAWEATGERQPAGLNERFWIVSDARIDARADLLRELNPHPGLSGKISPSTPDSVLILHAYDRWAEDCVDHLLGDFSFAIWDVKNRQLFCARDHFGIKRLYYARIENTLVFSNALDAIRLYPGCSVALCDEAIADFLLFGTNLHATRTSYEQILRLPRAHTLVASAGQVSTRPFWSFPIEEPLRHRRSGDYVDQFQELLHVSVRDRLRCDRAAICLSGGLDSPSVAAEAAKLLGAPEKLMGITAGFHRLAPDPEPPYARLVAEYLEIPWRFVGIDDYKPFERWGSPELLQSAPANLILGAMNCDLLDRAGEHSRVLLTGEGGDPGLVPSLVSYRGSGVFRLMRDVGHYVLTHGRHPRVGFGVTWRRSRGRPTSIVPNYPKWLDQELENRLGLRDRWNSIMREAPAIHPHRPDSYNAFNGPRLELYSAEDWRRQRVHLEYRHPLMDLRVQRFFLRLPVIPWCADKEILRVAMRGRLPQVILKRPKCPVPGYPVTAIFREARPGIFREFSATTDLRRFVVQDRIPDFGGGTDADLEINLRPINLNYWIASHLPNPIPAAVLQRG